MKTVLSAKAQAVADSDAFRALVTSEQFTESESTAFDVAHCPLDAGAIRESVRRRQRGHFQRPEDIAAWVASLPAIERGCYLFLPLKPEEKYMPLFGAGWASRCAVMRDVWHHLGLQDRGWEFPGPTAGGY